MRSPVKSPTSAENRAFRVGLPQCVAAVAVDKIHLFARGELDEGYHLNMGKGADARCLDFLRVTYLELRERVLAGGSDKESLEWCFEKGRRLNERDLLIWNGFISKFGWNDSATRTLERLKNENGCGQRPTLSRLVTLSILTKAGLCERQLTYEYCEAKIGMPEVKMVRTAREEAASNRSVGEV